MNSKMTNAQRAMQFWSVLALAAKTQQVVSYEAMERMTGIPRFGMSKPLGRIVAYCQRHGLPLLTAIVVEQVSGRPADQYFNTPPFDLSAEHRRVFVFDWLKHGCPALNEFQDPAEEKETNQE
jgi:hypothetical protein